jgi:hypothetical protein
MLGSDERKRGGGYAVGHPVDGVYQSPPSTPLLVRNNESLLSIRKVIKQVQIIKIKIAGSKD